MAKSALILFAHGARDPEWAAPLRRVADAVRSDGGRVELSFLEFLAPDLETCVGQLAEEGFERVLILPMFIAAGGHLKRDLPDRLARLHERYPQLELRLANAVGEADRVVAAMAAEALALLQQ